jgi:hypothetical protein
LYWKKYHGQFFKYMREEFLLDALVDYRIEPEDPTRSIPNLKRRALDKEVRAARADLAKLEREYGAAAADNAEQRRPTMWDSRSLMARSASGCAALASRCSSSSAAKLLSASRFETSATGAQARHRAQAPDRHHQDGCLSGRERSGDATTTSLRPVSIKRGEPCSTSCSLLQAHARRAAYHLGSAQLPTPNARCPGPL